MELLLRHGAHPLQANCKGHSPLDVAANQDIVKLLKNEIIASSSSSSSPDEVRSPTSPESNDSDQDDDKKQESQGMYTGWKNSLEMIFVFNRYMFVIIMKKCHFGKPQQSAKLGPLKMEVKKCCRPK